MAYRSSLVVGQWASPTRHSTLTCVASDESAQLRFLREARAAASVRHPNVASVFQLGRIGQNHFFAMEFVEGKPPKKLIKRSGPTEVKLALEIAMQVAAGSVAANRTLD
jgi:serine/threonine protein kinase